MSVKGQRCGAQLQSTMSQQHRMLTTTASPCHTAALVAACAALVFASIGFFDIGVAVFMGQLGWLADHIVPCGPKQAARSREDWMQILQARLQPVVRRTKAV